MFLPNVQNLVAPVLVISFIYRSQRRTAVFVAGGWGGSGV